MFKSIFENKKVLVTGHTGFKGSWLCTWLENLGAVVEGISDNVISSPSNYDASSVSDFITEYRFDLRDTNKIASLMKEILCHGRFGFIINFILLRVFLGIYKYCQQKIHFISP